MSYEMKLNDIWRYFSNMFNATDRVGSKTFTPRVLETIQPGIDVWPYLAGQHYEKRLLALDLDPNPAKVLSCDPNYWYIILGTYCNTAVADARLTYTSPSDEQLVALCILHVNGSLYTDTDWNDTTSNMPSNCIHDGSMGDLYVPASAGHNDVDVFIRYIKIKKPMTIIQESTA